MAGAAVTMLAAVAVPAASATWTHNYTTLQQNAEETFTGEFLYQSASTGQVKCTSAEAVIQLLKNQAKGTVTKLTCPNATMNAHVTGAGAAICGGQTILHKMELTKHATAKLSQSRQIPPRSQSRTSNYLPHIQTEPIVQNVSQNTPKKRSRQRCCCHAK